MLCSSLHGGLVGCFVGIFLLLVDASLLGLEAGLGEGLGGGVVDAFTTRAAGLDDGGVDLVEGLFL